MPADLDLRKLRYFVAVADELNFTRAAEVLHIAQPVLSRQIRALETELGLALFVRSSRGTALTEAGRQLAGDARALLAQSDRVRRRVVRAARKSRILNVGVVPGLLATRAVVAFEEANPDIRVVVHNVDWVGQADGVRAGTLDVVYAREPLDASGLGVRALATEPRDVALPATDPLATRTDLTIADLLGGTLLQDPALVPEWAEAHRAAGRTVPAWGVAPRTVEQKLELVASGRGFVVIPRTTSAFYRRPDVAIVPVADIGPSRVVVIWNADRSDPDTEAFVAQAVAHAEEALAG